MLEKLLTKYFSELQFKCIDDNYVYEEGDIKITFLFKNISPPQIMYEINCGGKHTRGRMQPVEK